MKRDANSSAISVQVGRISTDRPLDPRSLSGAVERAVTQAVTQHVSEKTHVPPNHLGNVTVTQPQGESVETAIADVIAGLIAHPETGDR